MSDFCTFDFVDVEICGPVGLVRESLQSALDGLEWPDLVHHREGVYLKYKRRAHYLHNEEWSSGERSRHGRSTYRQAAAFAFKNPEPADAEELALINGLDHSLEDHRHLCPRVEVAGPHSSMIYDHFRSGPWEVRPYRLDSAMDIRVPDWEAFKRQVDEIRIAAGVGALFPVGSPDTGGCTLYSGTRGSEIFVRIYQKGLKFIGEGLDGDPDHVRIEVEYRPMRFATKREVVSFGPDQIFNRSRFARRLWDAFSGLPRLVLRSVPSVGKHPLGWWTWLDQSLAPQIQSLFDDFGQDAVVHAIKTGCPSKYLRSRISMNSAIYDTA